MPRVAPFEGLVFDPGVVGPLERVTAPPYDVISDVRRDRLLRASPYSVVHLDLARGSADPKDPDGRYLRAARLISDWEAAGALRRSAEPSYYAYEMAFRLEGARRRIRGLLCAMDLEDWGGAVVPHERTMEGPVEDRLRLLRATRTQLSAVYGTVAGPVASLQGLLDEAAELPAPFQAVDDEGVRHRMWAVPGSVPVASWLQDRSLLIADGHHRYTTSLRYRAERRADTGPGPWDAVLTLIVDVGTQDLPVLPFHRVAREVAGAVEGTRVRDLAEILSEIDDARLTYGVVTVEDDSLVHRVARLRGDPPTVRALHAEVLDGRVPAGSLRFVPDASEAEAAVRAGEAAAAYLLPPTSTDRIRRVVEAGERLPQKSTYYWPKPRTGMVMRPLA
jgi:uncharacterized protein (DUF1015 family)